MKGGSQIFWFIVIAVIVLALRWISRTYLSGEPGVPRRGQKQPPTIVRSYRGTSESAARVFHSQAATMAEQGYYPVSQSYTPGAYSSGDFLFALLLCLVLIGILVFIYMLIVKPAGTLQVTYELRSEVENAVSPPASSNDTKLCPRCAETIKKAAVVCRFCHHEFVHDGHGAQPGLS
jgi:uncharacterized membrane protein